MHNSARSILYLDAESSTMNIATLWALIPTKPLITFQYDFADSSKNRKKENSSKQQTRKKAFFILNTSLILRGFSLIHFSIIMSTIITSCQRSANPMENPSRSTSGRRKFSISKSTQFFFFSFFSSSDYNGTDMKGTIYLFLAIYTIFDGEFTCVRVCGI